MNVNWRASHFDHAFVWLMHLSFWIKKALFVDKFGKADWKPDYIKDFQLNKG